jgi:eukaryotic-like serine/threonine-protein kinase
MSTPEGAGPHTPSGGVSAGAVGRYVLLLELAAGGMGAVYVGRLRGAAGFERLVAIKRMHKHVMEDRDLVLSFHEEARIASLVQHPNVVQVLDVYEENDEHMLVMEYVDGVSLSVLAAAARKAQSRIPLPVGVRIAIDAARGLHAAHETRGLDGQPLLVVHRDVSPHNILVAANGSVRVTDFGIARAILRNVHTEQGQLKGKVRYMSPEQAESRPLDRRADVFSLGIVLWELITGEPLYNGPDTLANLRLAMAARIDPPSSRVAGVPREVDAFVLRALARDPWARFPTAEALANDLESWAVASRSLATPADVAATVSELAGARLATRQTALQTFLATVRSGDSWPKPVVAAPPDATPATSVGTIQPALGRGRGTLKLAALLTAAGLGIVGGGAVLVRALTSPVQSSSNAPAERPSSPAIDVSPVLVATSSATASAQSVTSASARPSAAPAPTSKPLPRDPPIELRDNPYE